MRHTRIAGQALRLATEPYRQSYICQACLAQVSRRFSTSRPTSAEADNVPFWKRMQNSLFGTKESKQAEQSREEKTKRRVEAAASRVTQELETKTDKYGRVYQVADVVNVTTNDWYKQATTWDGLEIVGSERWVKARADQGEQYFGFMSKKQHQLSNMQWNKLLHHVTVEALALQKAGFDLTHICNVRNPREEGEHWTGTANATIDSNSDQITLRFADPADEHNILNAIAEKGTGMAQNQGFVGEEAIRHELVGATTCDLNLQDANSNKAWMQMSLRDSELKLAIVKRITQLTGKRTPDPVISNTDTLADLYNYLRAKEKPKKLAQTDLAKRAAQLPNVQIYATRRTPVHKEKNIGRWKVIEDELTLRNLPVLGSSYVDAKEGKILRRNLR